jgi:predicted membrane chloride channel (bestrophin family)
MENQEKSRRAHRMFSIVGMGIGGILIAMIMALLFGVVVMLLWNWLMPTIFGLTAITFWQAWGIVVLSHILFKSFPHCDSHSKPRSEHWEKRFKEKSCSCQDEAE